MPDIPTIKLPSDPPSPSRTVVDQRKGPATNLVVAMGEQFGDYVLLGEIARGGMGVVYRARQATLDRVVALKMILAGRLANPDDVQRFRTEAEAAARLQHPNIVAVHDVGDCAGQHYFTMEYIEGTSLDQRLAQGPLTSKAAARHVRVLARAVHYAHKQGILHRDLKPSNILIDADDIPHITDFGLAKRLNSNQAGQTRTGAVLGTPSYMSPEQAQGKSNELGPACDIYSLGAILYELMTGRPPFRAESALDTVMQVIDQQPVPPRLLNPRIDHDLETICLKCLEKEPQMRYASAEELGEDLQRYLDGNSISARSFNMIDRLARTLQRDTHTADFATWSSMVLVMAVVVGLEHLGVYLLILTEQPRWSITAARFLQFVLLGFLFWYHRRSRLLPTSAAERELWTIWIGYFTAYFCVILTMRLLLFLDLIRVNPAHFAHGYFSELLSYPILAMVSGLAFFIMGSDYWGRCYAIGAAFFVSAPLLTLEMSLGPLVFGLLWSIALVMLGLHLRQQGQRVAEEKMTLNRSHTQAATIQFQDQK